MPTMLKAQGILLVFLLCLPIRMLFTADEMKPELSLRFFDESGTQRQQSLLGNGGSQLSQRYAIGSDEVIDQSIDDEIGKFVTTRFDLTGIIQFMPVIKMVF
ncbi:MAG: hypothetical protein CMP47_10365 [Rickettsiales bacterium]|nr:hypothetical protein [Rickettsiales bacterium]